MSERPAGHGLRSCDNTASPLCFEPYGFGDTDGDLIPDHEDNCLRLRNYEPFDTDSDGYGDGCENGQGNPLVSGLHCAGVEGACPFVDTDGDGAVGIPDWSLLGPRLGQEVGPSGLKKSL